MPIGTTFHRRDDLSRSALLMKVDVIDKHGLGVTRDNELGQVLGAYKPREVIT
jgi:hypothetical protein